MIASRSSKIARSSASDVGLSQTTTRFGVLDEARTRPQPPFSSITRAPLTVTISVMRCPPSVPVPTLGGTVDLKVPAGARAGQRLRLKGRGLPGKTPGDHFVNVRIVTPPDPDAKTRELYEQLRTQEAFDPRAREVDA